MNRKKKVLNNTLLVAISRILYLAIGFISRKLIIWFVAVEYLGLNSLYSNILDLLNLAELGIGVAIQIRLYKPIVNKDYNAITNILKITKIFYSIIGLFVLISGIVVSFFLGYIIKDNPFSKEYIQISFLISVIGISLSYFCADKRLFFEANEEYYINTIVDLIIKILLVSIGLFVLYMTKEYLYYIAFNYAISMVSNLIIYLTFRKKHKELLKTVDDKSLQKAEFKAIRKNMLNVIPSKLGVFVFTSTDSIVISTILGLTVVGLYSNYILLFNSLLSISSLVSTALVATFGKMIEEGEDIGTIYSKFKSYLNIQWLFSTLTGVCIFCLIDKFVYIWLGKDYILPMLCVILLSFDYFIHSYFQPLSTMYTATGKFKEDKVCTLIAAILNIGLSILLAYFYGLQGVIIGTLVANIFTFIIRIFIIYKKYFERNLLLSYINVLLRTAITILITLICYFCIKNITITNPYLDFILCSLICIVISGFIGGVLSYKDIRLFLKRSKLKNE